MDTEWQQQLFASFLLVVILALAISFIVVEQPSTASFVSVSLGYCGGILVARPLFQRRWAPARSEVRTPSTGYVRIAGLFTGLITITLIIGMQLLGGKELAGIVVAGFLAMVCGTATYAIGYYWKTRPH